MANIEIVKENQLTVIVKKSNLEPTKAKFILDKFQDYFETASEWELKAKAIVVTNETQKTEMKMARAGRLFLREKRIAVEKARKELKEQALREGKAIDGIANVLKALIVPIEDYLEGQERFVEREQKKKAEALRIETEKRIEEERIAKEKADAEEQARMRAENERLRKEAEARDRRIAEERRLHDEIIAKERTKADEERRAIEEKARIDREAKDRALAAERAKAETEKKAIEDMARKEREKKEKALAIERAKVEAEKKKAEEKARKEKATEIAKANAERKEKERLAEILKNQIICPNCGHKFQLKKED